MNAEKLAKLKAQVCIGGKGTPRRKKKVVHKTNATDDKKLQGQIKKLAGNNIPGVEEANFFKDDGTVLHFVQPKVTAAIGANTYCISGQAETKELSEMFPGILSQMGAGSMNSLRSMAAQQAPADGAAGGEDSDDEDIPELVGNFDDAAKQQQTA